MGSRIMETSLTENEMHDNLNSGWENSPDENKEKSTEENK
jgi:hypothetical protein